MCNLVLTKVEAGITQSDISKIVFGRSIYVSSTLNVIAHRFVYQIGVLENVYVFFYCDMCDITFLYRAKGVFQFCWICKASNRRGYHVYKLFQIGVVVNPITLFNIG